MLPALLFLISMSSPLSICLGGCLASQENKHLECSNLYDFPGGTESVEVLRATNNTFIKIASDVFQQKEFVSLKAALLRHNHIRALPDRAFNGLPSLILLDLTGNRLEELQLGAFVGAESLRVLILTNNRLRHLNQSTSLTSLIFLDLSHNKLGGIPPDFLAHLPSIKYLDISHNPLDLARTGPILSSDSLAVLRVSFHRTREELSPELFANLVNLQVLDLSGSDLKVWPVHLLAPLFKLRVLYMDGLLMDEDQLVPATVEKNVQSEMDVTSSVFVSKILEHLDEFNATTEDVEFLQYLEDFIKEDGEPEPGFKSGGHYFLKKCLLFALLVYLSLMYTVCLSQVAKSLIYKPYQLVYVDEI